MARNALQHLGRVASSELMLLHPLLKLLYQAIFFQR